MSREQATRCTPRQLAYLTYWQQRGYTFAAGEVIPETTTPADVPPYITRYDLAASFLAAAIVYALLYISQ